MTLSTNIYVLGKIDGHDLHSWIHTNLFRLSPDYPVDYTETTAGQEYVSERSKKKYIARENQLSNSPGQGFPAWLIMEWTDDAREYDNGFSEEELKDTDDEDVQWTLETRRAIGSPYYARLNFDTAYGYNRNGMGCTELHASYIVLLYREYFEPRGIDIIWQDEYRGTYHKNLSEEGMRNFLGAGDQAMDWFYNKVSPIIQAEAAAAGGTVEWS